MDKSTLPVGGLHLGQQQMSAGQPKQLDQSNGQMPGNTNAAQNNMMMIMEGYQ